MQESFPLDRDVRDVILLSATASSYRDKFRVSAASGKTIFIIIAQFNAIHPFSLSF
jgi:hypothetical protein